MEKIINLTPDFNNVMDTIDRKVVSERMVGGPKATMIRMIDPDTGKVLGEYHNKIVITGSNLSASTAFGLDLPTFLPNYNNELNLDNTLDYSTPEGKAKNNPFVCLFCIGDSGCGTSAKDVFTVNYTDRIEPENDIIPFKYVDKNNDLNDDLRRSYFGRKTIKLPEGEKYAYYFKTFDTTPQLHLRYTDGTQINDKMYSAKTDQAAECFVETRLRITRTDFRDYFDQVLGWDNARISTLSLCYAWYDDTIDGGYRWYQQIYPYSKLNFSAEYLVDLTKAIDFVYQVFY